MSPARDGNKIPSPLRGEGQGEGQIKSRDRRKQPVTVERHAKELRRNSTDAENILWYHLRNRRLCGYKFRRQHPVGRSIADFICIDALLIVELDGGQHNEESKKSDDRKRTQFFEKRGFRVLRFWNNDVLENLDGVLESIASNLQAGRGDPSP